MKTNEPVGGSVGFENWDSVVRLAHAEAAQDKWSAEGAFLPHYARRCFDIFCREEHERSSRQSKEL